MTAQARSVLESKLILESSVYFVTVLLTTVGLRIASVAIELLVRPESGVIASAGKWFVFWGIGVRLVLAGISQVARPAFTASTIFRIKDTAAEKIVSELGYANVSMGLAGMLSLLSPAWTASAGLTGGLFLGLAGIKHAMNAERSTKENVAMATDLLVACVVAVYLGSLAGLF
jgi:hypothetical protein